MKRLYFVDDEMHVIDGMTSCIDWESEGIRVVGFATDGQTALQEILRLEPQVVITDIRMPVMNGFELIERVRERGLPVEFIIFSGFSEFEYARKTLRLEVQDYLIKPTDLPDILSTVKATFARHDANMDRRLKLRAEELQRRILSPEAETADAPFYACVVNDANASFARRLAALRRELRESAERHGAQVDAFVLNERLYLHLFGSVPGRESAMAILEEMLDIITADEYVELHAGIADSERAGRGYAACFESAEHAAEFAAFYDRPVVYRFQEPAGISAKLPALELYRLIKGGSIAKVQELVGAFRQSAEELQCPPGSVELRVVDLFYELRALFLSEYPVDAFTLFGDGFHPLHELRVAQGITSLMDVILYFCQGLYEQIHGEGLESRDRICLKAAEYIREHIAADISLDEAAGVVNVNPAYLSTLFKRYYAIGFKEYVLKIKADRAKELLRGTSLKIYEVAAAVGYPDPKYFCQMFKRVTGMTASQYRYCMSHDIKQIPN